MPKKKSALLSNNKGRSILDKIIRKGLFEKMTSELNYKDINE